MRVSKILSSVSHAGFASLIIKNEADLNDCIQEFLLSSSGCLVYDQVQLVYVALREYENGTVQGRAVHMLPELSHVLTELVQKEVLSTSEHFPHLIYSHEALKDGPLNTELRLIKNEDAKHG